MNKLPVLLQAGIFLYSQLKLPVKCSIPHLQFVKSLYGGQKKHLVCSPELNPSSMNSSWALTLMQKNSKRKERKEIPEYWQAMETIGVMHPRIREVFSRAKSKLHLLPCGFYTSLP